MSIVVWDPNNLKKFYYQYLITLWTGGVITTYRFLSFDDKLSSEAFFDVKSMYTSNMAEPHPYPTADPSTADA